MIPDGIERVRHMVEEGEHRIAAGEEEVGKQILWDAIVEAEKSGRQKDCAQECVREYIKIAAEALTALSHSSETVH